MSMNTKTLLTAPIPKLYLSYLLPTLIAMLSNSLYCLVDVYFISKGAGSVGLAALNIAMPIFTLYSAIGLLFGVGGATVMAVAEGSHHLKERNQAFTLSVACMLIIGIFISIAGTVFLEPFAYALGSSEALLPYVKQYMLPVNISAFAFVLMYAASILIRADHAPKLAMNAMLLGNISNMILDYVFVMLFGMGLQGAAIATCISPFLTIIGVSFHFILKKNTVHFTKDCFHKNLLKRICSNGLGSGIMEISAGAIILLFNVVILHMADELFLASYAIVTNIAYVCKGLLNGFAQGIQPIISANFGAGNRERVKEALKVCICFASAFAIIVYLIFLIFPQGVAALFANGDGELITQSATGIRLYFSSLLFTAMITMIMYYFQSIEMGKLSTMLAVLKGFVFIVVSMAILIFLFGIDAIWLSVTAAELFALMTAVMIIEKGRLLA